jgi:hypothetical protein
VVLALQLDLTTSFVPLAFELIDFGVRMTSSDGRGGRTKRNCSIAEVGKLNTTLQQQKRRQQWQDGQVS